MNQRQEPQPSYQSIVEQWAKERESLQYVQAYTARKAAQKALLFGPWIAQKPIDEIEPALLSEALVHLSVKGGKSPQGTLPRNASSSSSGGKPGARLGNSPRAHPRQPVFAGRKTPCPLQAIAVPNPKASNQAGKNGKQII